MVLFLLGVYLCLLRGFLDPEVGKLLCNGAYVCIALELRLREACDELPERRLVGRVLPVQRRVEAGMVRLLVADFDELRRNVVQPVVLGYACERV